MAATGQGWEQIREEWDLPRLEAWNKYCTEHPPVHLLVAAYLGYKAKPAVEPNSAPQLMAELPGIPGMQLVTDFPRPIRRDLMPWLKKTSI